ncbi:hypothetical protein DPMN_090151 [Dreissena polymorpha]|uniref:Uncharacterized protein n=1 Tax=Dreissena polymorpha TaxID=45954 RepID=A0A9D4KY80_DREPO|nr:hypothetical protein DPMN_090151 [Dreissena polymorpha]
MRNCNKSVTEKSIISLVDLDPSDLNPHQEVEVHARYLHAKYERDRYSNEGAMRNCNKSVTEGSKDGRKEGRKDKLATLCSPKI